MKFSNVQLDVLCCIAKQAGKEVMNVYQGEFDVELKPDESPLTYADLKADEIIQAGLMAQFPEITIVSEESQSALAENSYPHTFFLVDPLDGTKEFVKRNGEFTVNIALVHQGCPIAGVVYAPALDVMYFAGVGLGAWRRNSLTESIMTAVQDEQACLRVIGSRSHGGAEMDAWLRALHCSYSLVTAGSSLKFCKVAEGTADVYPRLTPTSQWDTAAAQCIVEAAGGAVLTLDGVRLTYGLDRSVLNPPFVAYGHPNGALLPKNSHVRRN